jgi:hypothetical protein
MQCSCLVRLAIDTPSFSSKSLHPLLVLKAVPWMPSHRFRSSSSSCSSRRRHHRLPSLAACRPSAAVIFVFCLRRRSAGQVSRRLACPPAAAARSCRLPFQPAAHAPSSSLPPSPPPLPNARAIVPAAILSGAICWRFRCWRSFVCPCAAACKGMPTECQRNANGATVSACPPRLPSSSSAAALLDVPSSSSSSCFPQVVSESSRSAVAAATACRP